MTNGEIQLRASAIGVFLLVLCFVALVTILAVLQGSRTIERDIDDKLGQILAVEFQQLAKLERARPGVCL